MVRAARAALYERDALVVEAVGPNAPQQSTRDAYEHPGTVRLEYDEPDQKVWDWVVGNQHELAAVKRVQRKWRQRRRAYHLRHHPSDAGVQTRRGSGSDVAGGRRGGYSVGMSRRRRGARRGYSAEQTRRRPNAAGLGERRRGAAAAATRIFRGDVAAPPRGATWIFSGADAAPAPTEMFSGADAAPPRPRRGYSAEQTRRCRGARRR